jgi:hypothetical protein
MTFRTNALKVQAFAGALFGVQVGTTTMAQVNADITSNGGLANTLNGYYASSFGSVANATVAASVAANLGLTGDALASGTAYITAQLNGAAAGARGAVISNILDLFAGLASDATFGAAATAYNARVTAANEYTGAANVAFGSTVGQGTAFSLTANTDIITGTSGDDTIVATVGTGATLNLADQINGGAGVDTLRIFSDNAVTLPAGLSNVEKIYISDTVHQSYDVSTSALGTVTSLELANGVTVDGAVMTLTGKAGLELVLTDLADADTAADAGDGDVAVAAAASVTSQSLSLVRVGAQAAATLLSATNDVDFDITGTGVATLSVAATGMNNISLANTGAALTTLNVSGDGTLAVQGTTATTITTFSAASNTGGVTVDLSASAGANQTITGGSGADTITVDLARNITLNTGAGNDVVTLANPTTANLSSTTGAADSINGGDGTDTLVLTAAGADALDGDVAADRAAISGFERVRISNDLNAVTVNAANISGGVNYVQLGADTTTANGTIAGVTSGATIENRAATHAGHTITIAGTVETGDVVTAVVNGATYSFTVAATQTATAAAAGLVALIDAGQGAGTATSALGVITLTTSTATAVSATQSDAGDDITIALAAGDAIETDITMTGATGAGTLDDLLNISLNGNITNNDDVESAYGVAGINRLSFTTADRDNSDGTTDRNDGYIVNLTNDNAVSLITVNGDRAFTFASTSSTAALATVNAGGLTGDLSLNLATNGLTQGVVITGGAGTNTITGTGFADNITGGARADTITSGNGADVVTGGAGADIFVIGAGSTGGTPSAAVFETITDFARASDIIRGAQTFTVEQSATASTGVAAINAEGIASFNSADDTLAERIIAVEAGITAGTESAGDFAIFELDGNSFVFIHDGTAGLAATDVLIRLTGVTGLSDSTISTTDLTIA